MVPWCDEINPVSGLATSGRAAGTTEGGFIFLACYYFMAFLLTRKSKQKHRYVFNLPSTKVFYDLDLFI